MTTKVFGLNRKPNRPAQESSEARMQYNGEIHIQHVIAFRQLTNEQNGCVQSILLVRV